MCHSPPLPQPSAMLFKVDAWFACDTLMNAKHQKM